MKTGIPIPAPVVGADHLVPKQENNRQVQQNLNILSTHYVAPKTHQELLGLQLRDRQSDIYGHVFGANAAGNDDCRRRVGNAHAALLRVLDRPDLRNAQDSLTRRFDQLGQAATRGNEIRNDLAKISSRGQATKFVVTKLIQGAAVMENAVELDVGINWRVKVKPRDGSEMIKHDASLGRSLNSKAFENLPLAFAGAYVASEGLSLAHDWFQPAYFTSIGAKRRDLAAAAEEFRADSERAANMRAGGRAAQAIVETYGERGRDFLESTMNEVDRSVYDYMQALQRQVPLAKPPDEQFAATGVTSASLQATYARLEEARFINTFTERGQDRNAVVEAWRPAEELPGAGVLLRATFLPQESGQSAARVRHDRSAEDPSSAEADPPRWDYKLDLPTALAELGRTAGNISGWGDYMRVQKDLQLARNGNAGALARLGELCEDGRAGKDSGPTANRVAEQLYEAAAAGGHVQGQYRLGRMQARGQAPGPAGGRSAPVAVQWLTRAAEQGHAQAQAELGVLHVSGRTGLDPRPAAKEGRRWCEKAVAAGVRSAELFFALGRLYDEGRVDGISEKKRWQRCKTFYAEAAGEGHTQAQRRLGLLHLNGSPGLEDGRSNDAVAATYLRLAAAQKDAIAAWHLAEMYRDERVEPTESDGTAHKAMIRYLTLAADGRHAPAQAQFALGVLHARGQAGAGSSEPDYAQAARRYRQAGTQGHKEAQFELARLLIKKLVSPDSEMDREAEAAHWCRLAAEQDSVAAQVVLANLYEAGLAGVRRGPAANQKMAEWLERAARQGDPDLQYQLAEHYFNGTEGLETGDKALQIAAKWYEQAAAQKHTQAQQRLMELQRSARAQPEKADETERGTGTAGPTGAVAQEPVHASLRPCQGHRGGDVRPEGAAASTSADESTEVHAMSAAQAQFAKGETLATNSKDRAEVHKGYRLMEDAASQGDPALQYQLAVLYAKGASGPTPGHRRALKMSTLLKQAADQGHPAAMEMLAGLYLKEQYIDSTTGRAVKGPDAKKAARLYAEKCMALEDAHSMAMPGRMVDEGGGAGPEPCKSDRGKAME